MYNVNGMVTDGSTFASGITGRRWGMLIPANLTGFDGKLPRFMSFMLGLANTLDAVSSTTIPLPPGQYATLAMLGTGVDGNQASQTFVVHYSDGTSSTFAQSMSDWFTPQNYAGESVVVTMPYRDNNAGEKDARTFYLYGYSFTLNSAKMAISITLPSNHNVAILAITVVP